MKKNNNRKLIHKHIGNNFNANSLAYKAIQIQGSVTRDGIIYKYDKETNLLFMSDGITVDYYEPLITQDNIEPFNKLLTKDEVQEILEQQDRFNNHWLFKLARKLRDEQDN